MTTTQGFCGNCGAGVPYGAAACAHCGLPTVALPPGSAPTSPQWAQPVPGVQPPAPMPFPGPAPGHGAVYGATYGEGSGPYGPPQRPAGGARAVEALLTGDWAGAARAAGLAVLTMLGVSLVGMLLLAAGELGSHETFVLVLGGACLAVGGDIFAEARGDAFDFESTAATASIGVLPLTVTLVGMVVLGASFARRLRRRPVARGRDVVLQMVRTSVLFALVFLPLSLLTRYTASTTGEDELADLVDLDGTFGVGVWSSLSGALLFAFATTGLVALLRRSDPLLGRFRARVAPALTGALVVFAAGIVAAVVVVIWALAENAGQEGVPQFLGISLLAFGNGVLAAVLWTAGVSLTGEGGLAGEFTSTGRDSVSLLTFTDHSGAFWLAPVVLFVVMLSVAVVVVLRQHTVLGARLEGLRFAAALGAVAFAAALLLRISVASSAGGDGLGASATATTTFNPFLAAFVLALWGAVTGLLAPVVAAALPPGLVQAVRRRYGMAPPPAMPLAPPPVAPPAPPHQWG
ncbi:streptophobe family protein [Blastococcus sp. SYSU D00695]